MSTIEPWPQLQGLSIQDRELLAVHHSGVKRFAIDAQVTDMLLIGLQTDGAHHKQWALWRIAEIMGLTHFLSEIEDRGIAP